MPVPEATAEGDGRPSVSDVIATTMQKRPAMMLGLPMVNDTGVSRTAKPIDVYASNEPAHADSGSSVRPTKRVGRFEAVGGLLMTVLPLCAATLKLRLCTIWNP